MTSETVGAVAAIASAAIAIGAAISAWASANRSASAEERSAKAAEEVVKIEQERIGHERERRAQERADRAAADAPKLDIGEQHGSRWTLAQGGRALVGFVTNHGPTSARIESVTLDGPADREELHPTGPPGHGFLSVGEYQQFVGPWPYAEIPREPLVVRVTFASGSGSGYRAEGIFELLRDGSDENGQPMWRSGESRIARLD